MKYRCGANGMKPRVERIRQAVLARCRFASSSVFRLSSVSDIGRYGEQTKIFFAVPVDVDSSDLLPGGRASCVTCASASVSVATMGALFTAFMALALLPVVEK